MEQYEDWIPEKVRTIKRVPLKPVIKKVNKHFHTCDRCEKNFVTIGGKYTRICDKCVKPRGFVAHKGYVKS